MAIEVNDVVQITPVIESKFRGCFMVVTEVKSWGVQGFISIPTGPEMPGAAYYRVPFEQVVRIGKAEWTPPDEGGE